MSPNVVMFLSFFKKYHL